MQYAYKVARSDRALNFITSTSTTLKPQLLKHWLERGGADSVEASFATELRPTQMREDGTSDKGRGGSFRNCALGPVCFY